MANIRKHLSHKTAIRECLRSLAINPQDAKANHDLAKAYLISGSPNKALPYAKLFVTLKPESKAGWICLAQCYDQVAEYPKAIEAYKKATSHGNLQEDVIFRVGGILIRLKQYDQAVHIFKTLLQKQASSPLHERLGHTFFKKRDFDAALLHFSKAMALNSKDTRALNGFGVCTVLLHIYGGGKGKIAIRKAVEVWQRSIQLRPNQPLIMELLARYGYE